MPFRLATGAGILSFLCTSTAFGTAVDISWSGLALECFFPADRATAEAMCQLAGGLALPA